MEVILSLNKISPAAKWLELSCDLALVFIVLQFTHHFLQMRSCSCIRACCGLDDCQIQVATSIGSSIHLYYSYIVRGKGLYVSVYGKLKAKKKDLSLESDKI